MKFMLRPCTKICYMFYVIEYVNSYQINSEKVFSLTYK